MTILSFDDVLRQTSPERCLLIGNGFNEGYGPSFKYDTLKGVMGKHLFQTEQYAEKDIEEIMLEIKENSNHVVEHIKQLFIKAITDSHPELNSEKATHCAKFLGNFSKVFTLNYDLLLYWVINSNTQLRQKFRDGMGIPSEKRDDSWPHKLIGRQTNTYYMHGALHLFCNKTKVDIPCSKKSTGGGYCTIEKLKSSGGGRVPGQGLCIAAPNRLRKQVTDNIAKGLYPRFISEGHFGDKKKKIDPCQYLAGCYEALKNESADIVIFGASFSNDQHILDAINASKLTKCFVGIYGDPESKDNSELIQKTKTLVKQNRTVQYFDSKTAPVWS